MSGPRVTLVAALGVALSCAGAQRARANPLDTYGIGSRSTARAGAVVADVEDFSASYYNPAGLARGTAMRIEVGYFLAHHELAIDGRDTNVDDVRGLVGGLVAPGRAFGVPFAFGIGLHLNDERLSRTRSLPQLQPRWEMYDNRTHRIFIAANLALRPWPWLLVGGGIAFMSATQSSLDIRGSVSFENPDRRSALQHEIAGDLTAVRYPQAGIQVEPDEHVSFGVAYRGEFQLRLQLDAELAGDIVLGAGSPAEMRIPGYFALVSDSVNAFLPQQVAFGVTVRPIPTLRIGADVTWVDWSAYKNPVATSSITLRIDVPPELRDLVRVPASIPGTVALPARFADRLVPRIGVEWIAADGRTAELALRAGWFFEKTPVPPQTGVTNFVDNDRHAFSLGAGLALHRLGAVLPGDLRIDVHLQWSHLLERTTVKSSLVDPIGDYVATGDVLAGGMVVGVTFP